MSGAQFLVFYFILIVLSSVLLRGLIAAGEKHSVVSVRFAEDPYRVAALRAGGAEAIRVAVFSLVDRGLLTESDGQVLTAEDKAEHGRRPIERAILKECSGTPRSMTYLTSNQSLLDFCRRYEDELGELGMLNVGSVRKRRAGLVLPILWLMGLILVYRVLYAILHGHFNLGFLIIEGIIAFFVLRMPLAVRLTRHGESALNRLRDMLGSVRSRSTQLQPGGGNTDAVLFASIFGLELLPLGAFDFRDRLFPRPVASSSSSGCSGGSSGCSGGSSGCSGGSSGCSGGCGGGGGCGGCGGGGD